MENDIKIIKKDLDEIKDKLNIINLKLDESNRYSKKLDSHIDFVESTYDSLVHPLNYIKNTVNRITGNENKNLLSIKNKK